MKKPKRYKPEPGDEFVLVKDLVPAHKGRIFEARDGRTGEGIVGYLEDANHYLLEGIVGFRFKGETLGIFAPAADGVILLKHEGYELPVAE
jgi:hypothetical protein